MPERELFAATIILIPAMNEEASIARVVQEARQATGAPILVIDDASQDATVELARQAGALVLPLCSNLGAWGALQAGLRYAVAAGYDYAITMDADGQHLADSLLELVRPVHAGEAEVCIGACVSRGTKLRKLAWIYLKRISGLSIEDITSGLRVYGRSAMALLAQPEATLLEYQDVGVLALMKEHGLHICEVQVEMVSRRSGQSRVFGSWLMVIYYMLHTSILGVSKRRFYRF